MLDAWKPIVPPNRLALRFMDCLGVGLLALGWLLGLALGLSFGSEGFGLGGLALTWVGLRLPALGLALCPSSILMLLSGLSALIGACLPWGGLACLGACLWLLLGIALGLSFGSQGFGLGGLALHRVGLRLPALGLALAWCWVLGVGGVGVWGGWCWGVGCGSGSSPLGAALVFAFCFANHDDD